MFDMKGKVLPAVANPKQFLFAPFELAIINITISIAVMILSIAVLNMTPFFAMVPLVFGHAALVAFGAKNPHLTTTLRAVGKYPSRRKNLAPVAKGVKYVP
jgi:hypothetical protein